MTGGGDYLFGVDLEDVRLMTEGGARQRERLPHSTRRFLDFLRRHGGTATFFVVGDVARLYPDLVLTIVDEGHEIACHSDRHLPLDRQQQSGFRDDLLRNIDALAAAGAPAPRGYRAPSFSLTAATGWAYEVLAELGFDYSSSVLPARSPLYGWPGFGEAPRLVEGIVEIPMTLVHRRLLPLPLGGGVYFRALPKAVLRALMPRARDARTWPAICIPTTSRRTGIGSPFPASRDGESGIGCSITTAAASSIGSRWWPASASRSRPTAGMPRG